MTEMNTMHFPQSQRTKILAPANWSHFVDPIDMVASAFGSLLV